MASQGHRHEQADPDFTDRRGRRPGRRGHAGEPTSRRHRSPHAPSRLARPWVRRARTKAPAHRWPAAPLTRRHSRSARHAACRAQSCPPSHTGACLPVDASAALALRGVRGVVLAARHFRRQDAGDFWVTNHLRRRYRPAHRQVIGLGGGRHREQARRAAPWSNKHRGAASAARPARRPRRAKLLLPKVVVRRGEPEAALKKSQHTLTGSSKSAGRNILSGKARSPTQLPLEQDTVVDIFQHPAPRRDPALGGACDGHREQRVPSNADRMGGGLWRKKRRRPANLAVWATLAARKSTARQAAAGRRRRLHGHRQAPPLCLRHNVGYDNTGLLTALQAHHAADCGFSADLSGPRRRPRDLPVDNAYF